MPRRPRIRQCNYCGFISPGSATTCGDCHKPLIKPRFKMTVERIQKVHVIAYRQKGLDRQGYEDVLAGVGVTSCKEMKEKHYNDFLKRMRQLPDVKKVA